MGKARIVSGGTEGNYTVQVLHNRHRIVAELSDINARLDQLALKMAEIKESLAYADLEVAEAKMLVDGLIDIYEEEGPLPPVDLGHLISLHNSTRSANGKTTLAVSAQLIAAAQGHAEWLATNNTTGHRGEGGSTPSQRIAASGYPGAGGENVAVGIQPPEDQALDAWMNSPGHRANILFDDYRHIGVGYACRSAGQQKVAGDHRHFWVAVFGASLESVAGGTPSAPDACTDSADDAPQRIMEAIEELAEKSRDRDIIRLEVTALEARKLSDELRKKELQAVPADPIQQAWCADYTEDLAGEVGTAEIPGEGNTRLIVRPGFDGRATVVPARDGQLFHRRGMTGPQAYFNAAILPGWQKFRPTYRVGTLTAINEAGDTASVNLDSEQSSAQVLGINQSSSLADVPIEYMDCNAEAFEVGDRVLVQFEGRDWLSPKVVGFESGPKQCPGMLAIVPVYIYYSNVTAMIVEDTPLLGSGGAGCYPLLPDGEYGIEGYNAIEPGFNPRRTWVTADSSLMNSILTVLSADELDFDAFSLVSNDSLTVRMLGGTGVLPRVEVPFYDTGCVVNGVWSLGDVPRPEGYAHGGNVLDGSATYSGIVSRADDAGIYRVSDTAALLRISRNVTVPPHQTLSSAIPASWLPATMTVNSTNYARDEPVRWLFGDLGVVIDSVSLVPGGLQSYQRAYIKGCYLVFRYKRA